MPLLSNDRRAVTASFDSSRLDNVDGSRSRSGVAGSHRGAQASSVFGEGLELDVLLVLFLRAAEDAAAETMDEYRACDAVYEVLVCVPFAARRLWYHVGVAMRVGHRRYFAGFRQLLIWKHGGWQ